MPNMIKKLVSGDAATRSTLRESIRRLKRIRVRAGKDVDEFNRDHAASTGDKFRDLVHEFINGTEQAKVLIQKRNESIQQSYTEDLETLEETQEVRRAVRRLRRIIDEMKVQVDESESLVIKENRRRKPKEEKLVLLERQFREREVQHKQCIDTIIMLQEMEAQRFGKRGLTLERQMELGKKANLREQLMNLNLNEAPTQRDEANESVFSNPNSGNVSYGNPSKSHQSRLETNEETADQMRVLAVQEAKINAGLNRLHEGVLRLNEIAVGIGAQLDLQHNVLDGQEIRMDEQSNKLTAINLRLRKVLKQTKPMNCCMNVLCCIFVIVIIAYILVLFNIL